MRTYFKVYRQPASTNANGESQIIASFRNSAQDELVYIKQFNKARAILAYNSLGYYHKWKAYDVNGTNVATFTGSQMANGLYIIGQYSQHPEN